MENKNQDMRLKLFDTLSINTVYSENILHTKISENSSKHYENMFRELLTMNGVTYVYKRGFHWRTWRKININNNDTVVCYKCQNYLNISCAKCYNGYWIIDKSPPCPYEIYSLIQPKTLCVINITQYYKPFESCPQIISLDKLMETCSNPLETKWRILRNYSGSENSIKICQGRDTCEITTLYSIKQDSITFRIVNSTNQIIYSRVMKSGQMNYACVDDCGYITPHHDIVKNDKHNIVLDLLHNLKNKRENLKENFITSKVHQLATPSSNKPLLNNLDFKNNAVMNNKMPKNKMSKYSSGEWIKPIKSVMINEKPVNEKSQCKKIQNFYVELENGSDYYDY
ncbi:uncharacterized protein LOC111001064 [Pieris rapae]|uniref:uncharacterized protein LOC111001064 n=1 Tax=Pieris rapae TaxID=64459 RepID=UPI001E27DE5F|nr:uncharacterized protein LOC111001064 [Pieris rapae]XP_045489123.1 uncharacterized protein LOC111001064 [Pieris rapae]